ncbi:MAG: MerR family transcriptional regulator [Clostridia bacterium]|nr:MerR family transcriptional regulator [Clostridia bacterium]
MMYTRGQFAVMGNVGRKALRLYHEEGLLVPVCINEENGYHYYDDTQLVALNRIKRLRKLGLSLFEIKQILDGNADENEVVESKLREADEKLKEMKKLATEGEEKEENESEPDIGNFERKGCIFIEENVELEDLGMSVGKLYERAARNNMDVNGSHFVRYEGLLHDENFRMVTCLPVLNPSEEETIDIRELSCLHLKFTGGFSKISLAHKLIREYAEKYEIVLTDRAYEVYNNDMSVDVYYTTK